MLIKEVNFQIILRMKEIQKALLQGNVKRYRYENEESDENIRTHLTQVSESKIQHLFHEVIRQQQSFFNFHKLLISVKCKNHHQLQVLHRHVHKMSES